MDPESVEVTIDPNVEPILSCRQLIKRYGRVTALDHADFDLYPNEIQAVIGDNGAGKSSLIKAICGAVIPDAGEIRLGGEIVNFRSPIEAREAGIETVYQNLALSPALSIADNMFLGREIKRRAGPLRWLDHKAMAKRAGELFSELKSETRPRDLVRQMSGGQRQAVAIARTRLSQARMVLMDEPTAAISVRQVAEVLDLIRRLKDSGMAIMLISHRMPDVFAVCDRVVVMRRGRKVADKAIHATSPEEVTGLITGAIHAA